VSIIERNSTFSEEPVLSGNVLGDTVVNLMKKHHLNPQYLVGIGTDGAACMTPISCGAAAFIRQYATNAIHFICASHSLNLSLSKSAQVPSVRNANGVIEETCGFFQCIC
jgi:hypothetical protein